MVKNITINSTFSNPWQVAAVVSDMDKTVKRLESLGIGPFTNTTIPPDAEMFFRGKPLTQNFKLLITQIGNLELELFEPDDKPSPYKEFLDKNGEGFHHIGYKVNDVEEEVNRLTSQGAEVVITGKRRGKLDAAYVDLRVGGIIVELSSVAEIKSTPFLGKFVHVAVAVRDIDKAMTRLESLGVGSFKPYDFDSLAPLAGKLIFHGKPLGGARKGGNVKLFVTKMGNVALELFEPVEGESPQREFLDSRGEGIHHIAFGVSDFDKELVRFTEKGVSVLQIARLENGGGACYLDLGVGGLIIELEKLF